MAKHMSIDAVLDEERRDVLALLERPAAGQVRGSATAGRASSPFTSTRSPVRSMLDIDGDAPPRRTSNGTNGTGSPRMAPVRSMLDVNGAPAPQSPPIRSMLDLSIPPKATSGSKSAQTSPTDVNHRSHIANQVQHRSLSDAASRPVGLNPSPRTSAPDLTSEAGFPKARPNDPESAYQFSGFLPSNPGGATVPKRNTQAGKRTSITSAMAEVMRGDLSSLGGRRRNSSAGGAKSRSPHNRLLLRSNSPQLRPADPSKFELDDGRVIDMSSAYRKLSDANLARSQGGLATLVNTSNRRRTNSGSASGTRLEKDYTPAEGEDALADSSDDEYSDEEQEQRRGRRKSSNADSTDNEGPESQTLGMGKGKGPRQAKSQMAAAEEERQEVAEKYKIRSLLEPQITVTGPQGSQLKSGKSGVHPHTSFDDSAFNTPRTSDTEENFKEIEHAQKLPIEMTSIISTPATSRCVRTIYRGDFAEIQGEAKDNQRRVRKYLVATDLSDEAAHAFEWTIGTVLRDGDTLLAIYCVDEELGITANDASGDDQMREQAAAIAAATRPGNTPILGPVNLPSPLGPGFRLGSTSSASESPMGRERGKAEQERYRAVQDITDRVARLLRKTKLQVKVVIEVIHCKSPKHLITEVIDYLSPTMVILGSRGRSALKGVILGSFSNYIVTKSSVPVMVARKRLRKHTKYKRPDIRLANNLAGPAGAVRGIATAKID